MRYHLLALLMLLTLSGCANKEEPLGSDTPARATSPTAPGRYLAYEHTIKMDAPEAKIARIFEAGQAACRNAAQDLCTVLASQISSGRYASATMKFRAKPAGIRKLIAALGAQAELKSQSTRAEDLEGPIADASKKLAMQKDYRAKLEALRERASADVDALIKVNRELAQVQSELEATTGTHAHLMQRVDTEILNVSIDTRHSQSFFTPISHALADFGTNLSQGVSGAIIGVAYLIPWALILSFIFWIGRKLWRRRKSGSNA